MKVPIQMPQLGESIAEATILTLHIAPGDSISADQEIMEVETNKATMAVTAPCSGEVTEISAAIDQSYAVGAVLGYLEVTEEEARKAGIDSSPPAEQPAPPEQSASTVPSDSHFQDHGASAIEESTPVSGTPGVLPTIGGLPVPANATGATYISPRLRARMNELGINAADLAGVAGSGAGGRVTVEDFERFMQSLEEQRKSPASPMRIAVADSMRRAWSRPHATLGSPRRHEKLLAQR
ncbi:MAG: E3 binding domain-containing protein, partial [Verrucomicrobiales bacterium]|nr:E3 binding domain-containing protein [Verrucomicrobiales bacterium]